MKKIKQFLKENKWFLIIILVTWPLLVLLIHLLIGLLLDFNSFQFKPNLEYELNLDKEKNNIWQEWIYLLKVIYSVSQKFLR